MASLKQIAKAYRDEILDGIAWVVIYKEGRSWNAKAYWPEDGDYDNGYVFTPDVVEALEEIADIDHKAICFNGYYMGFGEDFTLDEIINRILFFYDFRCNQLDGDFLECFVIH